MVGDVAPPEVGLFKVRFYGFSGYDISCHSAYLPFMNTDSIIWCSLGDWLYNSLCLIFSASLPTV